MYVNIIFLPWCNIYIYIYLHGAIAPRDKRSPHCRGFLISLNYTHHTQYDSSGRVISPTQSHLPDNTQHSQQTETMSLAGFEHTIPATEWPQNHE